MQCKIFAHRGLVNDIIEENTIKALINASDHGFEAVEFDLHYWNRDFILSHDKPEKANKKYDSLINYLGVFKNYMEYWLDFKNLDSDNIEEAVKYLKEIIDKSGVKLKNLYFAPFITEISEAEKIYQVIRKYFGDKVQIIAVKEKLSHLHYQEYYNWLKANNIYGLSIQFRNIKPEFMKIFSDIQIFAWTVNYERDYFRLTKMGVQNITTDQITQEINEPKKSKRKSTRKINFRK